MQLHDRYQVRVPRLWSIKVFYTLFINLFFYFGNYAISAIRLFQLFVLLIAIFFLFKTVDLLTQRKNAYLGLGSICILWIVPEVMCINIYGNVLGLSFAIISIYNFVRYIKDNTVFNWWFNLSCLIFSILFKQNFLIVLIAQILTVLLMLEPGTNRHF